MIYDCFTFYNEFDQVRIRLEELDELVDRFVVVESPHTFQKSFQKEGNTFWTWLSDNPELWYRFRSRVKHVRIDEELPPNPWDAEAYSRNAIMRALTRCEPDDLILISDADEVISASGVMQADLHSKVTNQVVVLTNKTYYYTLNQEVPWDHYRFPVALRYKKLHSEERTPQQIRELPHAAEWRSGGWHFSCLGDAEAILNKLGAFAHDDLEVGPFTIERAVELGEDFLGRGKLKTVDIDETYPLWVQQEAKAGRLDHLLRKVDSHA